MKSRHRVEIVRYAVLTVASLIMAVDYRTFVEWGGLYPGGVTGLSLLMQRWLQSLCGTFGWNVTVSFAPINFALNALPVWIGFKYIGKWLTLQSLYVIVMSAIFTDVMPVDAITSFIPSAELMRLKSDPFVNSVFGGIVFGFAMTLCLRWNATTGGTDFVAIFLSERKGRETWNLILAFNACILLLAGAKFGWSCALYSIVNQFVALQVVHLMYKAYQYQTLIIVTAEPGKMCEAIHRLSHHGATVMDARGGYRGEGRSVVMSVVAADDTTRIYAMCKTIDPNAFINVISTSRVIGRFYLRPRG